MQKDSKLFEGLADVASSAAGGLFNLRQDAEQMIADKLAQLLRHHQFVTREEFVRVQGMAEKARAENEALRSELEALKAKIGA